MRVIWAIPYGVDLTRSRRREIFWATGALAVLIVLAGGCVADAEPAGSPGWLDVYQAARDAAAEPGSGGRERQRRVSMRAAGVPASDWAAMMAREHGVSIVMGRELDERPVTLDVEDVPLGELIGSVARRLGAEAVEQRGGTWFLGALQPEEVGLRTGVVAGVDAETVRRVLEGVTSPVGQVVVQPDGRVWVSDRSSNLSRVDSAMRRLADSRPDQWVVQLHVVSLNRRDAADWGLDVEEAIEIATTVSAGSAAGLAGQISGNASVEAVVRWAEESSRSRVWSSPLVVAQSGGSAEVSNVERVPISRPTVSPEGTVTQGESEFQEVGFRASIALGAGEGDKVSVAVSIENGRILEVVEGVGARTVEQRLEAECDVVSGGAYLVGRLSRRSSMSGTEGGLRFGRQVESSGSDDLVFLRAVRIGGPMVTEAKS